MQACGRFRGRPAGQDEAAAASQTLENIGISNVRAFGRAGWLKRTRQIAEHGEARSAPVRMYCANAGIRGVFDKGARWKARWCVVKDGELSVYKQQGSAQAQWRFSLQGAETRQIFADDARVVGCKFIIHLL